MIWQFIRVRRKYFVKDNVTVIIVTLIKSNVIFIVLIANITKRVQPWAATWARMIFVITAGNITIAL